MFSLRANEFIGQLSNDMSLISYLSTCFFQPSSTPLLASSKWRKCKGNNNHIPNQKVKAETKLGPLVFNSVETTQYKHLQCMGKRCQRE